MNLLRLRVFFILSCFFSFIRLPLGSVADSSSTTLIFFEIVIFVPIFNFEVRRCFSFISCDSSIQSTDATDGLPLSSFALICWLRIRLFGFIVTAAAPYLYIICAQISFKQHLTMRLCSCHADIPSMPYQPGEITSFFWWNDLP